MAIGVNSISSLFISNPLQLIEVSSHKDFYQKNIYPLIFQQELISLIKDRDTPPKAKSLSNGDSC